MPQIDVKIGDLDYEVEYVAQPPEAGEIEVIEMRSKRTQRVLPQSLMELFLDDTSYGPMIFQAILEDLESSKIERVIELYEGRSDWGYVRKETQNE